MADEPVKAETPKEAPQTSQEFVAALDKLFASARKAGVRPLQVMATSYARQFAGMIDGLGAALEEGETKSAKKRKKKAPRA